MGRPAKFCKDNAIAIAMEAFWTKGYDGVSVSELSAAMNITRSSFYNCFKTREALFNQVLDMYGKSAPDYCLLHLSADAPIVPAIRDAFLKLCRDRAADPEAKGCMIINCLAQATLEDEVSPPLIAMLKVKIGRYEWLLQQAKDRGELDGALDVPTAAQTIITFMIGINMICKVVRSEKALWQSCDTFLNGLGLSVPE
jgi:TetR/AcrR family transcriptional regulator, transcriptional repressor for nem operon